MRWRVPQVVLEGRALAIFPCRADKHPACDHWPRVATADPGEIEVLWRYHYGPRIGVPTGEANGFDVLDVDDPLLLQDEGLDWLVPRTRVHQTQSNKVHFLFRHAEGVGNRTGWPVPGIDVRGDGGYVVWYPAHGLDWLDVPVLEWPKDLLPGILNREQGPAGGIEGIGLEELLQRVPAFVPTRGQLRYAQRALWNNCEALERAKPGTRNNQLFAKAAAMGRLIAINAIDARYVVRSLECACRANKLIRDDGIDSVEATIKSGLAAGLRDPFSVEMIEACGLKHSTNAVGPPPHRLLVPSKRRKSQDE